MPDQIREFEPTGGHDGVREILADPVVIAGHSRLSARRCRRTRCRAPRRETATPWYPDGRYYDPSTAQFISVDPAVAQTGDPYAYADDDPANLSDPTGDSWYNPASWNWGTVGLGAGLVVLTALNVAQLGADPVTDGLEVADVAALTTEAGLDTTAAVTAG